MKTLKLIREAVKTVVFGVLLGGAFCSLCCGMPWAAVSLGCAAATVWMVA